MANTTSHSILEGEQLLGFILLALLLFFTVFGNILVILAIFRTNRLQTKSNVLIINMACGDILYSVSTLPLSMVLLCFRKNWPLGKTGNIIFDAIWFSFLVLSFLNVVVIASERYIAIARPFTYKNLATKKRVICICLGLWIYVALLTFVMTFTLRKPDGITYIFVIPGYFYYPALVFHAFLAFVFVPLLYGKIFLIARKHKLEILRQQASIRSGFYRQLKATKTIGMVILLFFLVWLPFIVNQFTDYDHIVKGVWGVNNSIMCYITYCNGPVNILVYSCCNREIRKAILRLITFYRVSGVGPVSMQSVTI